MKNKLLKLINNNFRESLELLTHSLNTEMFMDSIQDAAALIVATFERKNKILICGNGGSAADSQHLAAEFVGRYEKERRSLPAIALTTDSSIMTAVANDYNFDKIFARQIEAFGNEQDLLIVISTSGNSENIVQAILEAKKSKMNILVLTGKNKGLMFQYLPHNAIKIMVPSTHTPRIQEIHHLIIHIVCNIIDESIV